MFAIFARCDGFGPIRIKLRFCFFQFSQPVIGDQRSDFLFEFTDRRAMHLLFVDDEELEVRQTDLLIAYHDACRKPLV